MSRIKPFTIVIASALVAATLAFAGCRSISGDSLLPKRLGQPAQPVSAERWLADCAKKVTPAQADLLKRAQATLLGNSILGNAWKPYRGIMPSLGTYRGVWNWDSAFHAVALSHWDAKFGREQFEILFAKQQPNGALPDVIWESGDLVTSITKPPVMAWAVAVVDRRSPDTDYLRAIYPKLVKLGDFWLKERGCESDGLFYYAGSDAGNESGWDNSIRWDNGYKRSRSNDRRLYAIDLNCYMVTHYRALAYIAERLNLADDRRSWLEKADALAQRINERLWDEQLGFYVDRDRKTGTNGPAISCAGFMPLFAHIAPPSRAARIAKFAADPHKFYPGMPTAAYDTPGYDGRGMWRGPAWLNTSYFALKGLQEYGYSKLADSMRAQLLDWVGTDKSTIWEYYDPKTGAGGGARTFGWSCAFTISFILDWDNDNLTWFFPPVPKRSGFSAGPQAGRRSGQLN